MPNWCYNFITAEFSSRDTYNKFLQSLTEKNWFETFAPLELDCDGNYNYSKANDVWKTKWAVTDVDILNQYDDEMVLELSFESAWSPPTGVYEIMSKKFGIDITGFYNESGCEFFGRCVYSKEKDLDETYEYPDNKEDLIDLRKILGHELDDFMSPDWERLEEEWQNEENEEREE
jgi:hypothetical protein